MSPLENLMQSIHVAEGLDAALQALLDGLAQRLKSTSNDQNVQKLAREIGIAIPGLVAAVAAKAAERASA